MEESGDPGPTRTQELERPRIGVAMVTGPPLRRPSQSLKSEPKLKLMSESSDRLEPQPTLPDAAYPAATSVA